MPAKLRIRNQYLLSILSLATELGEQRVSTALLVEAWKEKGRDCDESFFMHLDALHEYQFVKVVTENEQLLDLEQLLAFNREQDQLISITHTGREFFAQFGGR